MNSIVRILKEPTNRRALLTKRLEERFQKRAKEQGGRMVELGVPEDSQVSEAKRGIIAIEGLFFAINSTTYSPKFMDALQRGLEYMGQYHGKLLAQIGPEEVEKMKQANQPSQKLAN